MQGDVGLEEEEKKKKKKKKQQHWNSMSCLQQWHRPNERVHIHDKVVQAERLPHLQCNHPTTSPPISYQVTLHERCRLHLYIHCM